MILEKLCEYFRQLSVNGFSGKVELNFHKGNLSSKIKKQVTLSENDIDWVNAQRDAISPPPQAKGDR